MNELKGKIHMSDQVLLIPICAKDGLGLGRMIDLMERMIDDARAEETEAQRERERLERADLIGVGYDYRRNA